MFNCYLLFQVPLGIIMKNENKIDEMVDILTDLHQYIPMTTYTKTVDVPGTGDTEIIKLDSLHHLAMSLQLRGLEVLKAYERTPLMLQGALRVLCLCQKTGTPKSASCKYV